ncbi:formate dehydrogenase subunit gamma [Frankia sp. EI5c]|uniref:cytochrome b/b6 domain-containing protein n=1 Tax=Frankia sp. EI5c TaxID=683316 RepID=UPI0007C2EBD7|nr:cytochrome b/b6 domain-containing protein [Frankia sp. EI5c]OAA25635.1 formate dehydrogenase subunit gamma [Frankia sp. EI5c]
MSPSEPAGAPAGTGAGAAPLLVRRFGRATRVAHWSTAALTGVCLATAAMLYLGPLATMVGRRQLVAAVHLYAGLALPVPMLAAAVSAAYRRDVAELDRFAAGDWAWLRTRPRRRDTTAVGKFNAGQKLYAAFVAGAVLVLLGTGLIMEFGGPLAVSYRTGATFVHDLLALFLFAGVCGHLWMASRDPVARLGMRTGMVPLPWALREHPGWHVPSPPPAD